MEIILLQDVEKLGKRGDVMKVRNGFGRNFLLPQNLALPATEENRAALEFEKKRAAERKERGKEEALKLSDELAKLRLRWEVKVGEKGKVFGSMTARDFSEMLKQKGIALDRRQIRLPRPIRSLGTHSVTLELHPEVKPVVEVDVVKKP
ncbi:MAG: 50S ribosomal protein L9 [Candidatus Omnitrophica bacterium]|nr:50S ribosomal protein L9 [Candidatus Omnitrophota bacterium]